MRRVELFELIRRDHDQGLSVRAIAHKHHVHRRAVRHAITSAIPPERRRPVRARPRLTEEARAFVDGILLADRRAPRKQRHTARRIWQRLREELGCTAAESTVRGYVHERKQELGLGVQAFVPQHHPPGAQGEVDFYEAHFAFPWGTEKAQVIAVRSEFSAAALHVAYPAQTQTALLDGIERGLQFAGGVFAIMRFDNLRQAVARVIRGQPRVEQDRFVAFRSHYLFDASFTSPGIEGAHEKGGVEGEVGRFRRRWLTPVPVVASWEQANAHLRACCLGDLERIPEGRTRSVGELAEIERRLLRPLPPERFELAELASARVDEKSRIKVKAARYSVPASLVGRTVRVRIFPLQVEVSHRGRLVATHDRAHLRGAEHLVLDHYLDVLLERPGAFPGSVPLHQARERGEFPPSYDALWKELKERSGDKAGTRAMIEVLLLHRHHPKQVVRQAVEQALAVGAVDAGAVALFARHLEGRRDEAPVQLSLADLGQLHRYERPLPQTAPYDELLAGVGR
ncbi:MAG: IS21 family transposase [Actinomycetota bacterium]